MIRRNKTTLIFVGALLAIILVLAYNHWRASAFEASRQTPLAGEQAVSPSVNVLRVEPGRYQAQLIGYGAANPRFELTLSAQVTGQVQQIADDFEAGNRVKAGNVLLELENSEYRAALASAEETLANAKLALLQEQREGLQAQTEWSASGLDGEPDSELVLRKPQLAAAQAALKNAEASVTNARRNLAQTRITAPFDALITSRSAAPGSYLQTGSEVGSLVSTDRVEVAVALSAQDWASLPPLDQMREAQWEVTLHNVENNQQWQATVVRAEQSLDETTRQRALIVAVEQPLEQVPELLPGTFVEVRIPGSAIDHLWKLPSSALSQRGYIWYIGEQQTLVSLAVQPLFADAEAIYVAAPVAMQSSAQQILVHPLSSYLDGMPVIPVEVSDE